MNATSTTDLGVDLPRDFPMRKPCLFIPGAQKSGTTALFHSLRQSAVFVPPQHKEPQILSLAEPIDPAALEWYRDALGDVSKGRYLIDASATYFWSEVAGRRIKSWFCEPFVLILLRDPAMRAFSSYLELWKRTPQMERRSFAQVMAALREARSPCELPSHEAHALAASESDGTIDRTYLQAGYHSRAFGANGFDSRFQEPDWPFLYFTGSLYSRHVERWHAILPGRVKVVLFEEFVRHPTKVFTEIFEFLQLRAENIPAAPAEQKYPTRVPRTAFGRWYQRQQVSRHLRRLGRLGTGLDRVVQRSAYHKPLLSATEYEQARGLLASEYDYWQERLPAVRKLWRFETTAGRL